MFSLITYIFLKEGIFLFLLYLLLIYFYSILFHLYFYQFYTKKSIIPSKQTLQFYSLSWYTYFLMLLCLQPLSMTDTLFTLMGISLSIIDIHCYIVDPVLSKLFFLAMLISQLPNIHVILPIIVLLILLLISYLLPNQLGFGDVKLLVMWATFLSSLQLIWLIFIASSLGILFILLMNLVSLEHLEKIAFVPFLTTALTVVIYLF
ncbi:prepilin peptidase [Vagococcus sp. JNUCC 83]